MTITTISPRRRVRFYPPKPSSKLKTPQLLTPWPTHFDPTGRPLPSDRCVDGTITIFDGCGQIKEFIDPSTRVVVDARSYTRLGVRLPEELDDEGQPRKRKRTITRQVAPKV